MSGVTVVLEFNCYEKTPKASVWMVARALPDGHPDLEDFPNAEGALKILGPVEEAAAMNAFEKLKRVLAQAQVPFVEHTIADD